ncbi:3-dehydroquinate synthase [Deferrisoma camini]|uniref:3-dehydroquinate synthase n=1 Tax=Deferrisoma camini TaxID=1035120 RepID=UPI00046D3C21|nr:3-dehydroquinate synthase [Deferrisoma camini]
MRTLRVGLGERAYPVLVGSSLLDRLADLEPARGALGGRRIFLVTDRTVEGLWAEAAERALVGAGATVLGRFAMEPGEGHKNLETVAALWDALLAAGVERQDLVVAVGGGVVGDVAGFAAATVLRGVGFVQIPTTLLAMVDSSVGGKTGIDHPRGKNLIGAFHQPRLVVADPILLSTLPRREILSGLAEVVKAGLIGDPALFELLETAGPHLVEDAEVLEEAVARAVALKARVVEADEREAGERAVLNLGHTFGHAVEAAAGYGTYTHGEAVAMGLGFAARLSERLGLLAGPEAERIRAHLRAWGYRLRPEGISVETIRTALRHDKKSRGGEPRWVLLRAVGRAEWGHRVPADLLADLLAETVHEP